MERNRIRSADQHPAPRPYERVTIRPRREYGARRPTSRVPVVVNAPIGSTSARNPRYWSARDAEQHTKCISVASGATP